jgi:hypothetical protein
MNRTTLELALHLNHLDAEAERKWEGGEDQDPGVNFMKQFRPKFTDKN